MVALRVTSLSLFLALAACSVGEVPIGGTPTVDAPGTMVDAPGATADGPPGTVDAPGGVDPAASYTAMIFPLVSNDTAQGKACNSGMCHVAGGLPPDFSTFATLASRYRAKPGEMAKIVVKGMHEGPPLTAASKATIIAWINSLPDGV